MTKAELIFNISQRAGIPESEAQVFFESFLKKVAANINAGGAVRVDDLGMFIIKEGVSESIKARRKESRIEHEISELVLFQPDKPEGESSDLVTENEPLVFNLPNLKGEPKSNIDAYFSLSFDKPVVNRSSAEEVESYYPMSRNEQKRIIESKAEKLFSEVKIFDQFGAESEKYLFIGKQRPDADADLIAGLTAADDAEQAAFKNNAGSSEPEIHNEEVEEQVNETVLDDEDINLSEIVKENLAWDFGAEIKENGEVNISAPGSLNSENNYANSVTELHLTPEEFASGNDFVNEEEVGWDFGSQPSEIENELNRIETEIQPSSELQEIDLRANYKTEEEFVSDTLKEVTKQPEPIYEREKLFEPDFESVNSMTSELQNKNSVEEQMNWDFGRSDAGDIPGAPVDTLDETPHADGFIQISGRNSKSAQPIVGRSAGPVDYKPTIDFEDEPSLFQKIVKGLVFALIGILLAVISVYAYFKFVKHQDLLNLTKNEPVIALTEKPKTEVINRSYEVPVTYPYEKKDVAPTENNGANISLPESSTEKNAQSAQQTEQMKKEAEKAAAAAKAVAEKQKELEKKQAEEQKKKEAKLAEEQKKKDAKLAEKKNDNKKEPEKNVKQEKQSDKNASAMPKAGEHSFYDGSQFVIQVSSWPSKQKADDEAARLKKLGYSSFVTSAYLEAKKATWYRVRVGGFGSKEAAEKAYSKLSK